MLPTPVAVVRASGYTGWFVTVRVSHAALGARCSDGVGEYTYFVHS